METARIAQRSIDAQHSKLREFTPAHPSAWHSVSEARIMTVLGDHRGFVESGSAELVQRSRGEPEFRKDMNSILTKNCIDAVPSHSRENWTPLLVGR